MEFEAIIPLVTAITAAFGVPYAWRQAQHLHGSRSRSDFNFVKKYIRLTQETPPHPFVIESGFRVIRKKSKLDSPEILYLLGFERPSKAVRLFTLGREYLHFVDGVPDTHPSVGFAKKYRSGKRRTYLKWWYTSTYFVLAFLAFIPVVLAGYIFGSNLAAALLVSSFTLVFLGGIAALQLISYGRIVAAEKFIELQQVGANARTAHS